MDRFVEKMAETIIRESMFDPGAKVVAGVSGGPDSTALAAALHELARTMGLEVTLAHVNHGLRPGADDDEAGVRTFADRLGLPLIVIRAEAKPQGNLEQWARRVRYRALFETAAEAGASVVAVGHHRDDQAETVLINLLRGAGGKGLAGIAPVRTGEPPFEDLLLVRPLLRHGRDEIMAYLSRRGLEYRLDPSNQDPGLLRNRLRHEIIPLLESINPRLRESLARTGRALRMDADLVREVVESWLGCDCRDGTGMVIELEGLRLQVPGLRMAVYREAVRRCAGSLAGFGLAHFEALDRLVTAGPIHGALDLPGLQVRRERERLFLTRTETTADNSNQRAAPDEIELAVPGRVEWPGPGGALYTITAEAASASGPAPDPWSRAWLDPAAAAFPLTVRARRPGDRYQPFGLSGTRQLKDVMNQLKIPPAQRDRWPLVGDRDRILWVLGMRPAHRPPAAGAAIILLSISPALEG